MCRDLETVENWCYFSEKEKELLMSSKRPIVLLKKKNHELDMVSKDNNYLGVMLPYTPVHYLLFEKDIDTLVMTSGNISDTPIIYKNADARELLSGIADGFLMNNREIHVSCDDSLIQIFEDREYPIRRSRGYVPFPIKVDTKLRSILACGGEQKASFGLSKDKYVFLSQHIGDMKNMEMFENYTTQIEHFENIFGIKPNEIVCDLHPDYLSTDYARGRAKAFSIPVFYVQHHHAHMAACMADNHLKGEVIGVIWDGTGYGDNGEIWGGEFLLGGFSKYKRVGSIRPITLPGGDKAVKEIFRIAYSMLYATYGFIPEKYIIDDKAIEIEQMLANRINCPMSSSIGRLFDGIAAIIGIKTLSTYEGQGAIALEGLTSGISNHETYSYEFYENNGIDIFDWIPLVKEVALEIDNNLPKGIIGAKFMNTLAKASSEMVRKISDKEKTNIKDIVLSGGVFQNMYLLSGVKKEIENIGFRVYVHNRVSTNDEGIALGQILIAQNGGDVKCV